MKWPRSRDQSWKRCLSELQLGEFIYEQPAVGDVLVLGEAHLRRILKAYAGYYNPVRTHLSLDKDAPNYRRSQRVGNIVSLPVLGGLHH